MQFQLRNLLGVLCAMAVVMGVASRLEFRAAPAVISSFIVLPYFALVTAILYLFMEECRKAPSWLWLASAMAILALLLPFLVVGIH